ERGVRGAGRREYGRARDVDVLGAVDAHVLVDNAGARVGVHARGAGVVVRVGVRRAARHGADRARTSRLELGGDELDVALAVRVVGLVPAPVDDGARQPERIGAAGQPDAVLVVRPLFEVDHD